MKFIIIIKLAYECSKNSKEIQSGIFELPNRKPCSSEKKVWWYQKNKSNNVNSINNLLKILSAIFNDECFLTESVRRLDLDEDPNLHKFDFNRMFEETVKYSLMIWAECLVAKVKFNGKIERRLKLQVKNDQVVDEVIFEFEAGVSVKYHVFRKIKNIKFDKIYDDLEVYFKNIEYV